jgi:NDP-sugar pyrophosphorylase family protein
VERGQLDDVGAVILAGGRGTRLAPYTSILPKPLMPIGDRSILELVVDQLAAHGVSQITFCVGYLAHLIEAVMAHTLQPGVDLKYVHESQPMGTAAPLQAMPPPQSTFLVMNGDVLTDVDYGRLVDHHRRSGNVVTIATYQRSVQIEYGVLHFDEGHPVQAWEEKPTVTSNVSMGIYVVEPMALDHIPVGVRFDFPDLVRRLMGAGHRVGSYRHDGMWFDIGNHDDYAHAVTVWEESRASEDDELPATHSSTLAAQS